MISQCHSISKYSQYCKGLNYTDVSPPFVSCTPQSSKRDHKLLKGSKCDSTADEQRDMEEVALLVAEKVDSRDTSVDDSDVVNAAEGKTVAEDHVDSGSRADEWPISCNEQNVFKKPGTLTEVCTKLTDLQILSQKKRKKKRHSVDDEMSTHTAQLQRTATYESLTSVSNDSSESNFSHTKGLGSGEVVEKSGWQQKNEKLTGFENEFNERNEVHTKNTSSESTPCKKKSKKKRKKKKKSEFASPSSINSESNNVTSPVSVLNGTADLQKIALTNTCAQNTHTSGLSFHDGLTHSVENGTDELLGNDLPDVCSADLSENISVHMKSSEGGFEQLLMNMLFDDKSAKTNHSDHDKNCGEELEASGEKFTSSDSSSDDDLDNVNVVKEHTSASLPPVSSWNDSASNKVDKLKDNMMSPAKFEGEVKKSQDCSTCRLNRSPSLLDNTLLRWLDSDLQSPIGLDNISDINCSSPLDQTVTPNKSVWFCSVRILSCNL